MSKRRRGVTLMECLIVSAMLAVVLTMGMRALVVSRAITVRAEAVSMMSGVAQERLAEAQGAPFARLAEGVTTETLDMARPAAGAAAPYRVQVVRRVESVAPNLKEIGVVVTWNDSRGPATIRMATRVSAEGGDGS